MIYDFQKRSDDAGLSFEGTEVLTRQEFVSQVNISNIIKKYVRNGVNPFCITQDAKYGDFTNIPSYQEALELVCAAEDHFLRFPADVRAMFDNDPGKYIDFLNNPENREKAIQLGFVQDLSNTDEKIAPPAAPIKDPEGVSKP